MKTPLTINGWLIQATLKFLRTESPGLCGYITATRNNPPIQSVFRDDRESLLSVYELIMTYAEAFAIYSTLELTRQKFGDNRMFEGMQLQTMTELWREYATKLDDSAVGHRQAFQSFPQTSRAR